MTTKLSTPLLTILLVFAGCLSTANPSAEDYVPRLEKILNESILPFWFPETVDREHGGYRLNHDADGQWLGPAPKAIVTQSRMVWFFAYLSRMGFGSSEHLEAARHGFEFLRDSMWDKENGGFYWSVESDGSAPVRAEKQLYGQSFAIYSLAEYYLASKDRMALDLAMEAFDLLEHHAWDRANGGYKEFMLKDWSQPPSDYIGLMGMTPDRKLMNTHLHLMEAFTTLYEASSEDRVRERLIELINIQSNTVVRKRYGACTDRYTLDWIPLSGPEDEIVSYGHDVENVWLLMEAFKAAALADQPFMDLYVTLFDYSLKHGFDENEGGFFSSGKLGRDATDRNKVWWVQAEALVAALQMYKRTGQDRFLDVFDKTLSFVEKRQVDWDGGDWHAQVSSDGRVGGAKAGPWKSAYHNGRAVLKCLSLLKGAETTP